MKKTIKILLLVTILFISTICGRYDVAMADTAASSSFEVHFIDVGQGDSELIICDGKTMLIDGGKPDKSSLIYTYLKDMGINHLDYIVATHPHDDHTGGLSGALNYATVGTALGSVATYDNEAYNDFNRYLAKQGVGITVPSPGDVIQLGSATVQVLGPITTVDSLNNRSLVLKVTYGSTSFLFCGDAEREEEADILNHGYDVKADVLKVGHHGSDTSTTYPWLNAVMPSYAVIEVGSGNSYGHPCESTLSKLRDEGAKVYRTDLQGDIVCKSDGTNLAWSVEKNLDIDTLSYAGDTSSTDTATATTGAGAAATTDTSGEYILNLNTKKFHLPSCSSVNDMKEKNKAIYSGDRQVIIDQGYVPCKRCNP